jgi:hypothetical protein
MTKNAFVIQDSKLEVATGTSTDTMKLYVRSSSTGSALSTSVLEIGGGSALGNPGTVTVTGDLIVSGTFTSDTTGNVTGDIHANDGTKVLENGTNGTDATFTGDIHANDGTKVLENGTDGTDATFTGTVTGDVTGDIYASNGTKVLENGTDGTDALLTGKVTDISNHTTDSLSEGTNLYYTDSRVRSAISVTDSGGDGSLAYSSATGVITYTGPSATEVRAHFTAGTGVSISSGQISIGQSVGTTDNVTFNDMTISGDLTVNGTTTTINTTNTVITDTLIELGNGTTTAVGDTGIIMERGTTGNNAFMGWDESEDKFVVGTTTATGASSGNLSITPAQLSVSKLETTQGTVGLIGESLASGSIPSTTTTEQAVANSSTLLGNKHTVSCGKIFIAVHDATNTASYMSVSDYIHPDSTNVIYSTPLEFTTASSGITVVFGTNGDIKITNGSGATLYYQVRYFPSITETSLTNGY